MGVKRCGLGKDARSSEVLGGADSLVRVALAGVYALEEGPGGWVWSKPGMSIIKLDRCRLTRTYPLSNASPPYGMNHEATHEFPFPFRLAPPLRNNHDPKPRLPLQGAAGGGAGE
jgi:hypothetical protein